jgi:hypothetical protein
LFHVSILTKVRGSDKGAEIRGAAGKGGSAKKREIAGWQKILFALFEILPNYLTRWLNILQLY